jgi:hypothetical protein
MAFVNGHLRCVPQPSSIGPPSLNGNKGEGQEVFIHREYALMTTLEEGGLCH